MGDQDCFIPMPDGKRTADQMGFSKAELVAKLEKAKKRVVYIEKLLSIASRVACEHELVKTFPSGMRDNGEFAVNALNAES